MNTTRFNPSQCRDNTSYQEPAELPTVLIVDDEQDLADRFTSYLTDCYNVITTYTREEAQELLDSNIDIVLLNRNISRWSGEELLEVIEERKLDCHVMMITGVTPDADIVDLPIDGYVTKPVMRTELREKVEELLLRGTCDVDQQELLSLLSKKLVLEEALQRGERDRNEEYRRLLLRIEMAQDRLDITPTIIHSKHRDAVCPNCGLRWDLDVGGAVGFLNIGARVWKCIQCGKIERQPSPFDRKVARR